MPIKLLLADDSDVMRATIRKLLAEELNIEVIGTAASLAETLQLAAALKPDVVLIDPHMQDAHEYRPEVVKSRIYQDTKCIIAISVWTDDDSKTLAENLGAHVLLDKMNLYSELIPAIKQFCPDVRVGESRERSSRVLPASSVR